jgi:GTP-binding protein HflX
MRGLTLPSGRNIILSDTVGFISDLPTELVAAFRATLEEVAEADLILHVRDVAHPDTAAQRADVIAVLDNLVKDGTLDSHWPSRNIEVLNKADLLGGIENVPHRAANGDNTPGIAVSALTGEGLPALLTLIDDRLSSQRVSVRYDVAAEDGARLAWLYRHGEVLNRQDDDAIVHVEVRLSEADRARFERI